MPRASGTRDIRMDHAITIALYGGDTVTAWTRVMLALSFIGGGWAMVWFVPLLAWRRSRPVASALLGTIVVQLCLVAATKEVIRRVRPYIVMGWHPAYPPPHDFSFPSGHSAGSFTVAAFLVTFLMRKAPSRRRALGSIALLTLAGSIAFSRVYLGVHWAGDVVAGAIVGSACGWGGARFFVRPSRTRMLDGA
jgi:membrane-associated phospholipid phosphatase